MTNVKAVDFVVWGTIVGVLGGVFALMGYLDLVRYPNERMKCAERGLEWTSFARTTVCKDAKTGQIFEIPR